MLSTRSAVVAFAGLAALLAGPVTGSAAPTPARTPTADSAHPDESASLQAIQYNPGDSSPEHGPNSFVITTTNCIVTLYVEYRWEGKSGRVKGTCNKTVSESIAPSGGTEYPLQWRQCTLRWGKKPPLPFYICSRTYNEDVVRTG
ncbi:hypothetical protein AB0I60_19695 [Actinosynnema sp. NPDC050436]|uniref:hypothetical protein n=1 Tax=Actinosynnema sp. NPDC050436 TaxID=3155659 RepID=UPI00340CD73D